MSQMIKSLPQKILFPFCVVCISLMIPVALLACTGIPSPAAPAQPTDDDLDSTTPANSASLSSAPSSSIDSQATAQALITQAPSISGSPSTPTPTSWVPWLQVHSRSFNSVEELNTSGLSSLDRLLAGRRIVQLGESAHTTAEFSTVKARLIQYLHEKHGYNVIAFESGLLGCYLTQSRIESLAPEEAMEGCIFGVWHTEEVLPLFGYLIESQTTNSPLTLAGFDIRPPETGAEQTTDFFVDVAEKIDIEYAQEISELDQEFTNVYKSSSDPTELHNRLEGVLDSPTPSQWYLVLAEFYEENAAEIQLHYPEWPEIAEVARRAAWSRAQFILSMSHRSQFERAAIRDPAMASNLEFLLTELYPDEKIIVWAHNGHISNRPYPIFEQAGNMGSHIAQSHRDALYTIGLFGHSVSPSLRFQGPETFRALPGSVEDIFHQLGSPIIFVDMLHQQAEPGNEWMFKPMPMFGGLRVEPRQYFDAILFIDTVTGASYLDEE